MHVQCNKIKKKTLKKNKIFFLDNFKPNAHDYDDVDIKDIKGR